jgi:hypothetical protein
VWAAQAGLGQWVGVGMVKPPETENVAGGRVHNSPVLYLPTHKRATVLQETRSFIQRREFNHDADTPFTVYGHSTVQLAGEGGDKAQAKTGRLFRGE